MTGKEFAEIRDAVLGSFNAGEFDMLLFERFDFNRQVEVGDGPFKIVVTKVLERFVQEGKDPLLIAEVAAVRPLKSEVQKIYAKYRRMLEDQGHLAAVDDAQLKAIERYGLISNVILQKAGLPQMSAAVSALNAGLERKVRSEIPFLDVVKFREGLFAMEGRVCRIEMDGGGGTGFLVGPDVILTNFHVFAGVIADSRLAKKVRIRFDFKRLANGMESDGVLAELASNWLVDACPPTAGELAGQPERSEPTNDELDFALIRLDRAIGSELGNVNSEATGHIIPKSRGWILMPTVSPQIAANMPVMILQHPKGDPLVLALDTKGVLEVRANRILYAANTERGSSGSPVFDIHWKLIALHHYGDPSFTHPAGWNQGVPITHIRDRLKRIGKDNVLGGPPPE